MTTFWPPGKSMQLSSRRISPAALRSQNCIINHTFTDCTGSVFTNSMPRSLQLVGSYYYSFWDFHNKPELLQVTTSSENTEIRFLQVGCPSWIPTNTNQNTEGISTHQLLQAHTTFSWMQNFLQNSNSCYGILQQSDRNSVILWNNA